MVLWGSQSAAGRALTHLHAAHSKLVTLVILIVLVTRHVFATGGRVGNYLLHFAISRQKR